MRSAKPKKIVVELRFEELKQSRGEAPSSYISTSSMRERGCIHNPLGSPVRITARSRLVRTLTIVMEAVSVRTPSPLKA